MWRSLITFMCFYRPVDEETTDTSVFLLASMRVLGIASGVLLSEVAAVLIFPRSATQVCAQQHFAGSLLYS